MALVRYSLSLPETAPSQPTALRRFVKDVIHAGRFFVPRLGLWLDAAAPLSDADIPSIVRAAMWTPDYARLEPLPEHAP